jgi:hypothetical protein
MQFHTPGQLLEPQGVVLQRSGLLENRLQQQAGLIRIRVDQVSGFIQALLDFLAQEGVLVID